MVLSQFRSQCTISGFLWKNPLSSFTICPSIDLNLPRDHFVSFWELIIELGKLHEFFFEYLMIKWLAHFWSNWWANCERTQGSFTNHWWVHWESKLWKNHQFRIQIAHWEVGGKLRSNSKLTWQVSCDQSDGQILNESTNYPVGKLRANCLKLKTYSQFAHRVRPPLPPVNIPSAMFSIVPFQYHRNRAPRTAPA